MPDKRCKSCVVTTPAPEPRTARDRTRCARSAVTGTIDGGAGRQNSLPTPTSLRSRRGGERSPSPQFVGSLAMQPTASTKTGRDARESRALASSVQLVPDCVRSPPEPRMESPSTTPPAPPGSVRTRSRYHRPAPVCGRPWRPTRAKTSSRRPSATAAKGLPPLGPLRGSRVLPTRGVTRLPRGDRREAVVVHLEWHRPCRGGDGAAGLRGEPSQTRR
jgi:hypothetical protein